VGETGPLIPDQRREAILRRLHDDPVLSVHQLTQMLGVSHMTVRRDIAHLERQGLAVSVAGGVRLANGLRHEPVFAEKAVADAPEKEAMATAAAALLRDDIIVYLDAGTTTAALLPAITRRTGVTVITNDFAIVDALTPADHVEVLHTGGRLDHGNRSSVGLIAAETIRRLNCDLAVISANTWDLAHGLTSPSSAKVEVKRAAIESASTAVLMATSSKFGLFGMYDVAPLRRFDRIITDSGLGEAAADGIRDLGVTLDIATADGDDAD